MKRLIVTGDDFGFTIPVNEAIEKAHRQGILSAASLMIGAAAASDAVQRARRLPRLRIGLHIVLVEGRSLLPAAQIPDLVDENGEFRNDLVVSGIRFFFKRGIRRQLEAEIRAQFEAFRETGLHLDHVNAHNHMHLHPTVLALIVKVGKQFGLRAMRVPYEPPLRSWRASRQKLLAKIAATLGFVPWTVWMRNRLRQASIVSNDYLFGLNDTGKMREAIVLQLLQQLPEGITELYFHPAVRSCPELNRTMPDYQNETELTVLISPRVKEVLTTMGIQPLGYSDLTSPLS
jgi:hopanoid biosynthesis associated protein HpnK